MESLLQGTSVFFVYLDDILIAGRTVQEHLATLEEVLQWIETAGLRLKKSKCKFLVSSVTYFGSSNWYSRLTSSQWQSESNPGGFRATECVSTQVLPGLIVLSFKILAKDVLNSGTFVKIAEEGGTFGVGHPLRERSSKSQRLLLSFRALCLLVLLHLMELGQCFRTRFQMVQRDLLVLHRALSMKQKRDIRNLRKRDWPVYWTDQISLVLLWASLYPSHRTQTTHTTVWWELSHFPLHMSAWQCWCS